MYSGCGGHGGRQEAARYLEISVRLLHARDLLSSKRFAERAMDADPLLDGADEIVAVADVLLASQLRINLHHHDWYSILQLTSPTSTTTTTTTTTTTDLDFSAIRQAYRRLAGLLHPYKNRHPGADLAFALVSEGWVVLSDPTKKRLYDDEVRTATASGGGKKSNSVPNNAPPPSFWTLCPCCFRAYEYEKVYKHRNVKCHFCQKGFSATELPTPPPIVEGTDMYYCNWGMFPLGFPGCPVYDGVAIPQGVSRWWTFPEKGKVGEPNAGEDVGRTNGIGIKTPVRKQTKVLAKRPRRGMTRGSGMGDEENEDGQFGFKGATAGDFASGFDMNSFSMDLDATNEVLGNLANLPFLKDDEVAIIR